VGKDTDLAEAAKIIVKQGIDGIPVIESSSDHVSCVLSLSIPEIA
jgi:predicted transcriptional regulator